MSKGAVKLLANQLRELQREPVEGFVAELADEADLFHWTVWIEGPSDSPFAGGVFRTELAFPDDFPLSPPSLKFLSEFWHPNVYRDGEVCISILHEPGEDETSGEDASERWLPTRSVSAVLLSVISMLSAPNFGSPANVDASVMARDRPDEYRERVARIVAKSRAQAPAGLVFPHPDSNPAERSARADMYKAADAAAAAAAAAGVDDMAYDDAAADDVDVDDAADVETPTTADEKGKGRSTEDMPPTTTTTTTTKPNPHPAALPKKKKHRKCSLM